MTIMKTENMLWYQQPANLWVWEEALPLGNGRMGAMVYGGVEQEKIQLNEESLWSGAFRDRNNREAKVRIPEIRKLMKQGRLQEAHDLTRYAMSGMPEYQRSYQTLGDLEIVMQGLDGEVKNYRRSLSLDDAVADTSFTVNGFQYTRQVFVSAPADAVIVHLSTDCPQGMSFDARVMRNRFCDSSGTLGEQMVYVDQKSSKMGAIGFCNAMTATATEGTVKAVGEFLVLRGVKEAVLYVTAATTFRQKDPQVFCVNHLNTIKQISYEQLHQEHIADYRKYDSHMAFYLANSQKGAGLPTDKRLQEFQKNQEDLGLIALYFRYGRYLLISSSRPGTLPANLQGIWCKDYLPAWDSKYTININAEMNYWLAENCNLSQCHQPFFDLIRRMHPNGKQTAKIMYGAEGFVAHHNTDIWGDTAPQDTCITASYWVMGAAWMCLHIWEHYTYTMDIDFLEKNYDLLYDACRFFQDYLVENDNGELVIFPTISPENTYLLPNGTKGQLCIGCSMDSQILNELFSATIQATELLGKDKNFARILSEMQEKLPPIRIGKYGNIQEWLQDYEEVELGHRHISHLFALFPGESITPQKTPELAEAARKTLERRLSNGGGHTGWSRAWIINFWARLGDGEKAGENIDSLLTSSTLPNLFDNHPPFQIDGNFGGTAGIANMLMRSEPSEIQLLPALPKKWKTGKISGLKAKGDLTIDIAWENNTLQSVVLTATKSYAGKIHYGNKQRDIQINSGKTIKLDANLSQEVNIC